MTSRTYEETIVAEHAHCHHHAAHDHEHGALVSDPVCGMMVDTRTANHRYRLGETDYYFCSARRLEKFKTNPDQYLNPAEEVPVEVAAGTIWTCRLMFPVKRRPFLWDVSSIRFQSGMLLMLWKFI